MALYNIYMEGYAASGDFSKAEKIASNIEANNFKEACDKYFKDDRHYSSENLTYWACRLFDNLKDAQKSFG